MARALRVHCPGGTYHVSARGTGPSTIFVDDLDRRIFLELVARVIRPRGWACQAYCLMGTHYHLLVQTPNDDISVGMQRINGAYAQGFNRRHARIGALFQSRFHSLLVQSEGHALELARYIALNPVRAGLCRKAEEWPWGSYAVVAGALCTPTVFQRQTFVGHFGSARRLKAFVEDRAVDTS